MIPADSQIIVRTYLLFILREEGQLDKQGGASRQAGKEEQLGMEEQLYKHGRRNSWTLDRHGKEEQLGKQGEE
jgi:hypothetical protein